MRRNLKILLLVMIIAIVTVSVRAQPNINWAGNAVSISEFSGPTAMSTIINAYRYDLPFAGWTSTSTILPQVVAGPGMRYRAVLKTVAITKIQDAILTPDGGVTVWQAVFVPGIGWVVDLPFQPRIIKVKKMVKVGQRNYGWLGGGTKDVYEEQEVEEIIPGLQPGLMTGIEWRVKSNDKKNTLTLVFIPISWDSSRFTCVGSTIMPQIAPVDFEKMSDLMAYSYLRGFSPAWASPDPAVLAQAKMLDSLLNPPAPPQMQPQPVQQQVPQPVAVVPIPQPQPQPVPQPVYQPVVVAPVFQPTPQPIPEKVEVCGVVVQANPCTVVTIVVNRGNEIKTWRNQDLDVSKYGSAAFVKYMRGSQIICEADASYDAQTKTLTLDIYRGDFPCGGDQLEVL